MEEVGRLLSAVNSIVSSVMRSLGLPDLSVSGSFLDQETNIVRNYNGPTVLATGGPAGRLRKYLVEVVAIKNSISLASGQLCGLNCLLYRPLRSSIVRLLTS